MKELRRSVARYRLIVGSLKGLLACGPTIGLLLRAVEDPSLLGQERLMGLIFSRTPISSWKLIPLRTRYSNVAQAWRGLIPVMEPRYPKTRCNFGLGWVTRF